MKEASQPWAILKQFPERWALWFLDHRHPLAPIGKTCSVSCGHAERGTATGQVEQLEGPWPLPEVKSFLTPLGPSLKLTAYYSRVKRSSRVFLAVVRKPLITSRQLASGCGRTMDSAHQPFWEPAQQLSRKKTPAPLLLDSTRRGSLNPHWLPIWQHLLGPPYWMTVTSFCE